MKSDYAMSVHSFDKPIGRNYYIFFGFYFTNFFVSRKNLCRSLFPKRGNAWSGGNCRQSVKAVILYIQQCRTGEDDLFCRSRMRQILVCNTQFKTVCFARTLFANFLISDRPYTPHCNFTKRNTAKMQEASHVELKIVYLSKQNYAGVALQQ